MGIQEVRWRTRVQNGSDAPMVREPPPRHRTGLPDWQAETRRGGISAPQYRRHHSGHDRGWSPSLNISWPPVGCTPLVRV